MKKTTTLLMLGALTATAAHAQDRDDRGGLNQRNRIRHVLLLSIDGMHAVDFANCANGISTVNNGQPYCPAIAALGKTGINYEIGRASCRERVYVLV